MLSAQSRHRAPAAYANRLPDDRQVIATALLALSVLVLMLCAGIA